VVVIPGAARLDGWEDLPAVLMIARVGPSRRAPWPAGPSGIRRWTAGVASCCPAPIVARLGRL